MGSGDGGGAHVDNEDNLELKSMRRLGPAGVSVHVLYTIALGRYVQVLGLYYREFRRRYGLRGSLQDVCDVWSPDEEALKVIAREPAELFQHERNVFHLIVAQDIE